MRDIAQRYADGTANEWDRLMRREAADEAEWERKHTKPCKRCRGLGKVVERVDFGGHTGELRADCPTCHGAGEMIEP